MRIAVFGASGMLGSMLVDYLSKSYSIIATVRCLDGMVSKGNVEYRQFDCQDFKGIELANIIHDSDWVINAIGAIPQRCQDKGTFCAVNAGFPLKLGWYVVNPRFPSEYVSKPVIQIATDCVFSGKAGPYLETDEADDKSDYARSKHLGELLGFYNLRCSIIGLEPEGRYSLLKWLLSHSKNAKVMGYTNHFWNGITTLHFAKICEGIIRDDIKLPSLQHIVPADWESKFAILKMAASEFGRSDIRVFPIQKGAGMVDRRLATINPVLNLILWQSAGYPEPPTIEQMIMELAWYKTEVLSRR